MAKHSLNRLRLDLDASYNNGVDTFRLALLKAVNNQVSFTVDLATDLFTSAANPFINNTRVKVSTTGGLPPPLNTIDQYYVVATTANEYKLSATLGGAAIDITSNGTGTHTIIEQPIDETDALDVIIRHEVAYAGSIIRPIYNPAPAEIDYITKSAFLPQQTFTIAPTAGAIDFRYSLLIRNGNGTALSAVGEADNFEDHLSTQSIPQNGSKGIQVTIRRRNG